MSDPIEDLYKNLKELEPYFDKYLQSDPITIGRMGVRNGHGCLIPSGEPAPDGIPEITVNGRYITIVIEDDREWFADWDFSTEIMVIRDGDRIIYSKENLWDHWYDKKTDWWNNILRYYYDIREGTLVSGVVYAAPKGGTLLPSDPFTVRLVRDPQCMAIGAFTLPCLPVGLLYAPPQPQNPPRSNTIKYTIEQGAASTMKFSLKDESSRTVPTEGLDGPTIKDTLAAVQAGSKAAALMGVGAFAAGIGTAAGLIDTCLETNVWETTKVTSTGSGASFQISSTQSTSRTVGNHGEEAGIGDQVSIIQNVRFAWVSDDLETVKLMPLGPAPYGAYPSMEDLLHDATILSTPPPPPPPPPIPPVKITSIFPTDPDGFPYISLGQPFTVYGGGFSSNNAENQIVIFHITSGVAQPGIAVTPTSSLPDKLEAIAPRPPVLDEGDYEIRVEVQNQEKSNYVDAHFHGAAPFIHITQEMLEAIRKSLGLHLILSGGLVRMNRFPNVPITAEWIKAVRNSLGLHPIPLDTELKTGLDLETIQALLALDPLLESGPNTDLSNNPRFQRVMLVVEGGMTAYQLSNEDGFDANFTTKLAKSATVESTEFTSNTEQHKPGLLDKLFCEAKGETLKHTTTVSTTHQDETWLSRAIRVTLAPTPGQAVQCYYDTVFDSYIFQLIPAPYVQAEGIATDATGNPLPRQWILFSMGDQSVLSRTDAQGNYTIYSANANTGPATLLIGNREQQIEILPRRWR